MNPCHEKALEYIKSKVSVLPVGKDKVPLIAWKEFQIRLATEAEINEWWRQWPDANVGIITGKISGITVVDVEKGGDVSKLPKTAIIKTGGGGWHYYYKYVPFTNKGKVFPLTDVRGDGGFVVAPPSVHASGQKYEVYERRNMAEFPLHLFGQQYKINDWKEIVKGVPEGNRNDTAARVIGKLCAALHPNDWEALAWPMLRNWNQSNVPPMSDYELRTTFNSIARRELAKGREEIKTEEVEFVSFTRVVEEGVKELDATRSKDIISFGYPWLDNQVTGIFKGELIVIGGETGTGKTTWATNIIYKASKEGHKCAVFALEDRLEDYGIKALYFEIGKLRDKDNRFNYPWNAYRRNEIVDRDYPEYKKRAAENLRNDNVYFARVPRQLNIDLFEKLVESKVDEGFDLFLVDHLHHFDLSKDRQDTKADYIEKLMVRMVNLNKRTGARILLVVHYKKLNGQKPTLDSFKDAMAIPQNANYVVNIWRDRKQKAQRDYTTTFAISKARNPNGEAWVDVKFNPTTGDYESLTEEPPQWHEGVSDEIQLKEIPINY